MIVNAIRPYSINYSKPQNKFQSNPQRLLNTGFDTVTFGAKITKPTHTIQNVIDIFDGKCTDIPKHLKAMVSQRTNKILGFTLKTSDKTDLKVLKKMSAEYGADLRYLSFEETVSNGLKRYVNIDLDTKEILKSSVSGKPVVEDGMLYNLTQEELENTGVQKRLDKYLKDIFAKSNRKTSQEATILTQKKNVVKKAKVTIDDIKVEDLEDEKLNKLLDQEMKSGNSL